MENLKRTTKEQRETLKHAKIILYSSEDDLGNWIETEVIKSSGKYYRIQAINKLITEFIEV